MGTLKEKLISPPRTPNSDIIIASNMIKETSETSETTTLDRSYYDIYESTTIIRFEPDSKNNPFKEPSKNKLIVPTFLTRSSTDDTFYYNLIKNKDKGLAKRKVTFRQILTTQSSSILSGQEKSGLRYRTRYNTRSNNLPEELSDDNNNNDDNDQGNNPLSNC